MQKGVAKQIDESGIMMVFDTLQKYQYSFPIKSTVRELLCNGIDSVMEKKMAREILTGRAKVEDYFVDLEGPLYKDSKFNKDYYDLKWLNDRDDQVYMTYVVGGQMSKDQVVIQDNGVGLGGKRLEGYFKLAYSTKRLSKLPLGKFGLGAKAPLSIGLEYYTMETCYNGRRYRFQIYSNTYYSVIPQFNLDLEKENESVVFNADDPNAENHYRVYWEPTTEKNSVKIIIDAKKHHKQQYLDAVKSQMLYFEGIVLKVINELGAEEVVPYKAGILYEDDMIVMSDNNYYSKPHLLLNKVNYGYIDWSELELQDMQGNIGIKVQPEDVEVNPSRESVLWTEKTKEKVLKRFEEVVQIASDLIQEELKETDLVKWIKVCNSISGRWSGRNTVVGRLSEIVDLSRVKPKFNPDPTIVYDGGSPLRWIFNRAVSLETDKKAGITKKKISRMAWAPAVGKPLLLVRMDEKISNRKDKYLLHLYPDGFNQIHEPFPTRGHLEEAHKNGEVLEIIYKWYNDSEHGTEKMSMVWRNKMWDFLQNSSEVIWYDKVEVPENFTGSDEEEDVTEEPKNKEEAAAEEVARLTAEERRKLEGKTILQTIRATSGTPTDKDGLKRMYEFQKVELPIRSINDWDAEEIYYGYEQDAELLHFVGMLTRDPHPENVPGSPTRSHAKDYTKWRDLKWWRTHKEPERDQYVQGIVQYEAFNMQHYFDTKVMVIKVAQNNSRYYRDFQKVQEFFIQIKDNTITMSNTLIKWNTARIVRDKLAQCAFLYNFDRFNPAYASMYQALCQYVDSNYREVQQHANGTTYGLNDQTYGDLLSHLENVRRFQDFVAKGRPADEVAKLAQELFGNRELQDGMAVDPKMMRMLEDVIEFTVACGPMFNYIPLLHGCGFTSAPTVYAPGAARSKAAIPEELEVEIRMLLEHKGVLDYKTSFELEIEGEANEIENSSPGAELMEVLEAERSMIPQENF
jgi:hypothetical protein